MGAKEGGMFLKGGNKEQKKLYNIHFASDYIQITEKKADNRVQPHWTCMELDHF